MKKHEIPCYLDAEWTLIFDYFWLHVSGKNTSMHIFSPVLTLDSLFHINPLLCFIACSIYWDNLASKSVERSLLCAVSFTLNVIIETFSSHNRYMYLYAISPMHNFTCIHNILYLQNTCRLHSTSLVTSWQVPLNITSFIFHIWGSNLHWKCRCIHVLYTLHFQV